MLTDTKRFLTEQANHIKDWKSLNKNVLCNLYIEKENNQVLSNSYFAAIILKYWNKIYSLYANTYLTASQEDAYDWVVEGILYALKNRKWKDPNNKLFTDPNAPDKVINRKIKCLRLNHLISQNRVKRKAQINILSLDSLEDGDNILGKEFIYDSSRELVKNIFNSDPISSVIVDLILNDDCFEKDEETNKLEFSKQKLVELLLNLDSDYINYFSLKYDLTNEDLNDIINKELSSHQIQNLWDTENIYIRKSEDDMKELVDDKLLNLRSNKEVISFVN